LIDRITLANITGTLNTFGRIDGPEKAMLQNITLKNIDVKVKDTRVVINKAKNLKSKNVKINGVAYAGPQETSGK
jgi:hypothetical protein